MSDPALALRQVRFTNKAFWRNPASAFFTFAFPLMFLVIFTTLLGNDETTIGGATIRNSTFYVASMAAFGLISACYTNIAINISFARDQGVLKRLRGTPMPGWAFLTARVIHATLVAFLLVAITLTFGVLAYDAGLPNGIEWVELLVSLVVGAGCFAAIGLAIAGFVPNADAAPPIVNAFILPLLFLSGVFIPIADDAPAWVKFVGKVFPVRPLSESIRNAVIGRPVYEFHWGDVWVMAGWLVVGVVVASRFFSWEPRK